MLAGLTAYLGCMYISFLGMCGQRKTGNVLCMIAVCRLLILPNLKANYAKFKGTLHDMALMMGFHFDASFYALCKDTIF